MNGKKNSILIKLGDLIVKYRYFYRFNDILSC